MNFDWYFLAHCGNVALTPEAPFYFKKAIKSTKLTVAGTRQEKGVLCQLKLDFSCIHNGLWHYDNHSYLTEFFVLDLRARTKFITEIEMEFFD